MSLRAKPLALSQFATMCRTAFTALLDDFFAGFPVATNPISKRSRNSSLTSTQSDRYHSVDQYITSIDLVDTEPMACREISNAKSAGNLDCSLCGIAGA